MNLELAIKYLKNNKIIKPIEWEGDGTHDVNEYKVKIFYSLYDKTKVTEKEVKYQIEFLKLADLLEKEGELICQLEFILRDIPMEDVKKFDLELIKQNLIYHSMHQDKATAFDGVIVMSDNSPLASLGWIVYSKHPVTVIASMKAAIICSVFVNLCKEAGLEGLVNLCIVPNIVDIPKGHVLPDNEPVVYLDSIGDINSGCIGIVTAKADIDSAVDVFLSASDQRQWQIRTIFVQESVINHFKNALEWKATKPTIDTEIQKVSSNVYQYENKLFVYEFVGDSKKIVNATTIEGYRTVKELITLTKYKKSNCASIWSNDIAESNEIVHNIASTIVWINGYGHIGNPQTANAFYSIIHRHHNRLFNNYLLNSNNIESIKKKMSAWANLDKRARFEIVTGWLCKLKSDNFSVYENRLVADDSDSSVSVGRQICISMKKPVDFIVIEACDLFSMLKNEHLLKFLIDGGGIVFRGSIPESFTKVVDGVSNTIDIDVLRCIEKAIFMETFTNCNYDYCYKYENNLLYTNKVIWSSIGTVFAN